MHDGLLGGFQLKKNQKLGTLLRLLLPIMAAAAAAATAPLLLGCCGCSAACPLCCICRWDCHPLLLLLC